MKVFVNWDTDDVIKVSISTEITEWGTKIE